MKLSLSLEGPEAAIVGMIPLVARAHGWKPTDVKDDEGKTILSPSAEQVTASQLESCLAAIKRFLRESATAQAVQDAQEAARTAAAQQSKGAADLLTLSLGTT